MFKTLKNNVTAVGEPPICMSTSIMFAIRQALRSAREDLGLPYTWLPMGESHLFCNLFFDNDSIAVICNITKFFFFKPRANETFLKIICLNKNRSTESCNPCIPTIIKYLDMVSTKFKYSNKCSNKNSK